MATGAARPPATVGGTQLKPNEQLFYDQLFDQTDSERSGLLKGIQVKGLFPRSQLPKETLAQIWDLSDRSKRKALSRQDFYVALRLIAAAQCGYPVDYQTLELYRDLPFPAFQGIPVPSAAPPQPQPVPVAYAAPPPPVNMMPMYPAGSPPVGIPAGVSPYTMQMAMPPQMQMAPPAGGPAVGFPQPMPGPSPPSSVSGVSPIPPAATPSIAPSPTPSAGGDAFWAMDDATKAKYIEYFRQADEDLDNFVSGPEAKKFFAQSNLSPSVLRQIWILSDHDKDGKLSADEFAIAMHLARQARRKDAPPLPPALPETLVRTLPRSASVGSLNNAPQAPQHAASHSQLPSIVPEEGDPLAGMIGDFAKPSNASQSPPQVSPSNSLDFFDGPSSSRSTTNANNLTLHSSTTAATTLTKVPSLDLKSILSPRQTAQPVSASAQKKTATVDAGAKAAVPTVTPGSDPDFAAFQDGDWGFPENGTPSNANATAAAAAAATNHSQSQAKISSSGFSDWDMGGSSTSDFTAKPAPAEPNKASKASLVDSLIATVSPRREPAPGADPLVLQMLSPKAAPQQAHSQADDFFPQVVGAGGGGVMDALQKQAAADAKATSDLAVRLNAGVVKAEGLGAKIAELKSQVDNLQQQQTSLRSQIETQEQTIAQYEETLKEKERELHEKEEAARREQEKLDAALQRLHQVQAACKQAELSFAAKGKEIEDIKARQAAAEKETEEFQRRTADLDIENAVVDQQLLQLRSGLKAVEDLKENQKTILDGRLSQQARLRRDKADLATLLTKARTELETLKQNTVVIKESLVVQEESNELLRQQLEETNTILASERIAHEKAAPLRAAAAVAAKSLPAASPVPAPSPVPPPSAAAAPAAASKPVVAATPAPAPSTTNTTTPGGPDEFPDFNPDDFDAGFETSKDADLFAEGSNPDDWSVKPDAVPSSPQLESKQAQPALTERRASLTKLPANVPSVMEPPSVDDDTSPTPTKQPPAPAPMSPPQSQPGAGAPSAASPVVRVVLPDKPRQPSIDATPKAPAPSGGPAATSGDDEWDADFGDTAFDGEGGDGSWATEAKDKQEEGAAHSPGRPSAHSAATLAPPSANAGHARGPSVGNPFDAPADDPFGGGAGGVSRSSTAQSLHMAEDPFARTPQGSPQPSPAARPLPHAVGPAPSGPVVTAPVPPAKPAAPAPAAAAPKPAGDDEFPEFDADGADGDDWAKFD